jgi:antitoxin HicB
MTMRPAEYLKMPYGRVVVPESDGTFRAEIVEFPGCIAVGDTSAEALANLEDVAESWLEATLAGGQRVPEPIENQGFSGKLVVRLPKTLHKKAAHVAAREGVSLNQFIVNSVAEQVGVWSAGSSHYWPSFAFSMQSWQGQSFSVASIQQHQVNINTGGHLMWGGQQIIVSSSDSNQMTDPSIRRLEWAHAGS